MHGSGLPELFRAGDMNLESVDIQMSFKAPGLAEIPWGEHLL